MIQGSEVTVTVATQHFDINSEGEHWHLWVNGQLEGMVYQESGIIDLSPGTYQICASMSDANHVDLGVPDGITITVQQPAAGTPTPIPVLRVRTHPSSGLRISVRCRLR